MTNNCNPSAVLWSEEGQMMNAAGWDVTGRALLEPHLMMDE